MVRKTHQLSPTWDPLAGEIKDADFVAPLGSVFDDSFFNGCLLSLERFEAVPPEVQLGMMISPAGNRAILRRTIPWR